MCSDSKYIASLPLICSPTPLQTPTTTSTTQDTESVRAWSRTCCFFAAIEHSFAFSHQWRPVPTLNSTMTSRNNTSRNYDNNPPPSLRAPNGQNPPSVRRNIFSSHPRRQAATSSLSTATSSTSQNVHSDVSVSAKEDIIIRDETGDFRLELPTLGLPPMREDQKEDQSNITPRVLPQSTLITKNPQAQKTVS